MGIGQARVSMMVTLTFLAPEVQAAVLLGMGRADQSQAAAQVGPDG